MAELFVDANLFLDVMRLRSGWQESAKILDIVKSGKSPGFVSSLTVTTLFYELRKNLPRERVLEELRKALSGFLIADLSRGDLSTILSDKGLRDFEDRVQFYSAKKVSNIIVTRNTRDFREASKEIEVLTPEEFLNKYGA